MSSWIDFERAKSLRPTDINDIAQQLSAASAYLGQLTQSFGKRANSQLDRARTALSDAAHDTHENLRDNVVVSLVLAAGVGLFVGYLIGRGSDRDL
jgi:ElaB/YqjD/DUF883 family membrane-anchored ribosome-binding protein